MTNTNELTDKLVLFLSCLLMYAIQPVFEINVVPILITISIYSFLSYYENKKVKLSFIMLFFIFCLIIPSLILFIPLIFYEIFQEKYQWFSVIMTIPIITIYTRIGLMLLGSISILCFISLWLKYRTTSYTKLKERYNIIGDNARELSEQLKFQNKELLEKIEVDKNMATLKERNRIAREIHDNVGHQLSSAILQTGALLVVNKENNLQSSLLSINNTLSDAMNSIRESVHDLHDQSVDLHMQIEALLKDFLFCEVIFEDQFKTQPHTKITHAFISITKEALSNIIKHSNATCVYIILREHPAFYQFIIKDNGTINKNTNKNGLGLLNMSDRIRAFNGNINFHIENGFKIFISIPKEEMF